MKVRSYVGYVEVECYGNSEVWSESPALLARFMLSPGPFGYMLTHQFGPNQEQMQAVADAVEGSRLPEQIAYEHSCFRLRRRTLLEEK